MILKIIGDGEKLASMFVSPLYHPNITMNDFALIGYFTIKYIDKFELHNCIGLGGQKPQVCLFLIMVSCPEIKIALNSLKILNLKLMK